MRKLILVALLVMTAGSALATGRFLAYKYAFPGAPTTERTLLMDSEPACELAKASVLAGPLAAIVRDAGGTFTAECR